MTTATQRAKIDRQDLSPRVHKYRVMLGDEIIGQYSNLTLATETAYQHHGAGVVWDMSAKPPKMVCRDGKLLAQLTPDVQEN